MEVLEYCRTFLGLDTSFDPFLQEIINNTTERVLKTNIHGPECPSFKELCKFEALVAFEGQRMVTATVNFTNEKLLELWYAVRCYKLSDTVDDVPNGGEWQW